MSTSHLIGTPMPEANDDDILLTRKQRDEKYKNQYKPLHLQEVRDDKGRRRFTGAFKGGFSAGYFNTVGSKEGWAPSQFVSSRDQRSGNMQQKPEDFMDAEDYEQLGLGSQMVANEDFLQEEMRNTNQPRLPGTLDGGLPNLLPTELLQINKAPIGHRLLQKMGWRPGQGVGPRKARAAYADPSSAEYDVHASAHLFAPEDVAITEFDYKDNSHGIGYEGVSKPLEFIKPTTNASRKTPIPGEKKITSLFSQAQSRESNGGFGLGVFDDDDEDYDPFSVTAPMDPNMELIDDDDDEHDRARSMQKASHGDMTSSGRRGAPRTSISITSGHVDSSGRPVIPGFIPASSTGVHIPKFPAPTVPSNFVPFHTFSEPGPGLPNIVLYDLAAQMPEYMRAQLSRPDLNARTRSAMLSEEAPRQLSPSEPAAQQVEPQPQPAGEFNALLDMLSATDRERLEKMTGVKIPQSKHPRPSGAWNNPWATTPTPSDTNRNRGEEEFRSFEDPYKEARYQMWIREQKGLARSGEDWRHTLSEDQIAVESAEFERMWGMFKPDTGLLADRFQPIEDYAKSAASMKMFGALTRKTDTWYPEPLLCKRFNIANPHSRPQGNTEEATPTAQDQTIDWDDHKQAIMETVSRIREEVDTMKAQSSKSELDVDRSRTDIQETTSDAVPDLSSLFSTNDEEPIHTDDKPSMDLFKAIFEVELSDEEQESEQPESADKPVGLPGNQVSQLTEETEKVIDLEQEHPLKSRFEKMKEMATAKSRGLVDDSADVISLPLVSNPPPDTTKDSNQPAKSFYQILNIPPLSSIPSSRNYSDKARRTRSGSYSSDSESYSSSSSSYSRRSKHSHRHSRDKSRKSERKKSAHSKKDSKKKDKDRKKSRSKSSHKHESHRHSRHDDQRRADHKHRSSSEKRKRSSRHDSDSEASRDRKKSRY